MPNLATHPMTNPWQKPPFRQTPYEQPKSLRQIAREDKEMRENLTEKQIDDALRDSFPASDPPGNY